VLLDPFQALFIRETALRMLSSSLFVENSADARSARVLVAMMPDDLVAVEIPDEAIRHLFFVNRLAKGFWESSNAAARMIETIDRQLPHDMEI
jgi:hypothetical protein